MSNSSNPQSLKETVKSEYLLEGLLKKKCIEFVILEQLPNIRQYGKI